MSSLLKRAAFGAIARTGLHRALRRAHGDHLLIVCYHGLRADDAAQRHWLLLARSAFERQIRHLRDHYECIAVDEAVTRLRAGTLRGPTACVTFDDGYRSNLTVGLPILRSAGVPATIYLTTGLIGTGRRLWTTEIELAFAASHATRVDLAAAGLGAAAGDVVLGGAAARAAAARRLVEALKLRPASERRVAVAALLDELGVRTDADGGALALLDWDEVRTLGRTGVVTFGGHTVHHEIVSRLADDEVVREIAGSVAEVRAQVPDAVSATFAYPNGRRIDYDARAAAAVVAAGCTAAMTTIDGLNEPATPPLELRRLVVGGDMSHHEFVAHATGAAGLARRALRRG